jgi:hypothetical protein
MMQNRLCIVLLALGLLPGFLAGAASARAETEPVAYISIIIDDLGYRLDDDLRATALPGPVAYAILPRAPHAARLANLIDSLGKEVLLHLPMQAHNDNHLLGPGALTLEMSRAEFARTLAENLSSVPHVVGINNHMGSVLTGNAAAMRQLMELIKPLGYFYLDSLTSSASTAADAARASAVPFLARDVFLDNRRDPEHLLDQFMQLIDIARRKGSAIAIGHPYPVTTDVLAGLIPQLEDNRVRLVSLKDMLALRTGGATPWQASWSHSPRVAKSSRP